MKLRRLDWLARIRQFAAVTLHCDAEFLDDACCGQRAPTAYLCSATRSMIRLPPKRFIGAASRRCSAIASTAVDDS
jgi:hypothetical protein